MKKNDLIKLLQSIEGNPDVLIYNGFVEDYQDLDRNYIPTKLYKYCKNFLKKMLILENLRDNINTIGISDKELNNIYRNHDWELVNEFCSEEDLKNRYTSKKVVIFNTKSRNKETFNRLGSIKY